MSTYPQKPGYYWAKWKIASEGTCEGDILTPSNDWEIVQVNWNSSGWDSETDEENSERLSVSVAGVRETQWRDQFFWGSFVGGLAPKKPVPGEAPDPGADVSFIISTALRDAQMVTDLIMAGKKVPRAMTEDLRNHVRRLAKSMGTEPGTRSDGAECSFCDGTGRYDTTGLVV